jgi:hypothetical protein
MTQQISQQIAIHGRPLNEQTFAQWNKNCNEIIKSLSIPTITSILEWNKIK